MDLTDTWHGRFYFPRLYEPQSFVAVIEQAGEWLAGRIEERGVRGATSGKTLHSTLSGRLTGLKVVFLKTYDVQTSGYDAVCYAGRIGDRGLEINGKWSIPASWSGTFIMIRARGLPAARGARQAESLQAR